ncbi:dTDP-4-dehydrorhamnose reductase [Pollutimonas bauzanensis]|uniref:dTDP-4-dehydrorhamnose reductase n=1 Tax=Pollutimonas bauzanensis TaxID=658167 RepID=A0A1M5ZTQ7_9BURK|nr:dTDP-4-dehydrorhamnose reductase [Pollutimonas bauzanensis]SHI27640.1 dTDP-4-dehydrorhamnose reductase [Pollutimonas bauzanensis]
MKILLLGKDGQVGRELQPALAPLGELIALGRPECDLEDSARLELVLQQHAPDIIVNAAAYTAVDKAESDEITARKVNALAVHILASYASANNILLVHYSTDYVFDGEKPEPYTEQDQTNPQSAYGRTKREGEEAILRSGCQALIFRTSWVFSAHGDNFIKTIMRLSRERDHLSIVADQIGAPTSAELIAEISTQAITAWQKGKLSAGIYNLAASGETSWHGFAVHIVERLQANGLAPNVLPRHIKSIATEEYPTPAQRPKNSRLNTAMLAASLGVKIPHWTAGVDRIIDQLVQIGL